MSFFVRLYSSSCSVFGFVKPLLWQWSCAVQNLDACSTTPPLFCEILCSVGKKRQPQASEAKAASKALILLDGMQRQYESEASASVRQKVKTEPQGTTGRELGNRPLLTFFLTHQGWNPNLMSSWGSLSWRAHQPCRTSGSHGLSTSKPATARYEDLEDTSFVNPLWLCEAGRA